MINPAAALRPTLNATEAGLHSGAASMRGQPDASADPAGFASLLRQKQAHGMAPPPAPLPMALTAPDAAKAPRKEPGAESAAPDAGMAGSQNDASGTAGSQSAGSKTAGSKADASEPEAGRSADADAAEAATAQRGQASRAQALLRGRSRVADGRAGASLPHHAKADAERAAAGSSEPGTPPSAGPADGQTAPALSAAGATAAIDAGFTAWLGAQPGGAGSVADGATGDAAGSGNGAGKTQHSAGRRDAPELGNDPTPGNDRRRVAAGIEAALPGAPGFGAVLTASGTAPLSAAASFGAAAGAQMASAGAEAAAAAARDAASPAAGPLPVPIPVPIATPLNAPEFPQALGLQLSVLARNGVQQAELHLNPADMGPVSVQIVMEGTQARIDFGADVAATREAIQAGMPQLASALSDAGFTLAGGGVSQHAGGRGGSDADARDADRRGEHPSSGRGAGDAVNGAELAAGLNPGPARRRTSIGGLDLYA